jgi:predicted nucleic acid-binding protein
LVLVDNSTLSSLTFIGRVNLLSFLFDQIIIPQAIKDEFEYHHHQEMAYDFQIKSVDEFDRSEITISDNPDSSNKIAEKLKEIFPHVALDS